MVKRSKELVRKVRAAVIGAGPAGIGAALELAARGVETAVFERHPYPGGVLKQCIHTGFGVDLAKIAEGSGIQAVRTVRQEGELPPGRRLQPGPRLRPVPGRLAQLHQALQELRRDVGVLPRRRSLGGARALGRAAAHDRQLQPDLPPDDEEVHPLPPRQDQPDALRARA